MWLVVKQKGDDVEASIEDDGVGFGHSPYEGAGKAVANCRERLALAYAGRAELEISARDEGGTRVRVSLPLRRARTQAVDVARAVLATLRPKTRKMAVRSGAAYVVFDADRVAAVLAQDHYATLLVDGRELLSDDSLDKLMGRLDDNRFLRVHRGAILNVSMVDELKAQLGIE